MKISYKTLLSIVCSTAPLSPWTTASIIGRFYCNKLVTNGACSHHCERDCHAPIRAICYSIGRAEKPAALVTYVSKREAAAVLEAVRERERRQPVKKPVIFSEEAQPDNPFEALLEII